MDEMTNPTGQESVLVVDIQFRPGQKVYFFDPDGGEYHTGDHVIIDTARGEEYGICAGGAHTIAAKDVVSPLRRVIRKASAQDEKTVSENRVKESRAFEIGMQKIAHHQLDMQLVSAEYAFDGSKILFYFTADERVDFRELVKDLASVFHTRIELRQIGVRDKAKMVGGLGICGRPFCCASFLDDFQPVSIKMAKTQNLSLNPTKISGTCGRLMCCLKYEQDTYEDLIRTSPKVDSFVDTPDGRGTVIESQILHQRVRVRMEENPDTIGVFANEDIAVLRSGKAKKTDEPIPADLAPISGGGKRAPKKPEPEEAPSLEPIRFRYSTESVTDTVDEEKPEEISAEVPQEPEEEKRQRSRRRRGSRGKEHQQEQKPEENPEKPEKPEQPDRKPRPQKERQEKQPEGKEKQSPKNNEKKPKPAEKSAQEKPAAEKPAESENAPDAAKRRRRPNYRHHRRPKSQDNG